MHKQIKINLLINNKGDRRTPGRYKDNFVMDPRYNSPDYTLIYTLSIPLTYNQDKAEEEIIEAITFYHNGSKEYSAEIS